MRSLWGAITPNIRKVSIEMQNDHIFLFFYYDQEPNVIEEELSEDVVTEVFADFPEFSVSCKTIVIQSPKKITQDGFLIYSRYEGE